MKPTIGRIVVVNDGDDGVPAIVTRVHSEFCVDVTTFPPNGASPMPLISVSEGTLSGQWVWPPRGE